MRKAYSIVVTLIALGLLAYILTSPSGAPERSSSAASSRPAPTATAVPYSRSNPYTAQTSAPTRAPSKNTYVINKNTKKFHVPSCSSVKQMKESNKKTVTSTRLELVGQGYSPCQRCRPK